MEGASTSEGRALRVHSQPDMMEKMGAFQAVSVPRFGFPDAPSSLTACLSGLELSCLGLPLRVEQRGLSGQC